MDIMKAILEIENKAQKVESSVDMSVTQIKAETDEHIKEIQLQSDSKVEKELEKYKVEAKANREKELNEVTLKMGKILESLEEKYAENKSRWIDEITEKITEGDMKWQA